MIYFIKYVNGQFTPPLKWTLMTKNLPKKLNTCCETTCFPESFNAKNQIFQSAPWRKLLFIIYVLILMLLSSHLCITFSKP